MVRIVMKHHFSFWLPPGRGRAVIMYVFVVFIAVFSGCVAPPFNGTLIINPTEEINALYHGCTPTFSGSFEFQGEGTIQILCRIDSVVQYATTYHHEEHLNYQKHWFIVRSSVLKVEKGEWGCDTLVFPVFECDGGIAEYLSVPFRKGRFFLFGLRRHRDGFPEIIFYQQRSRFPGHAAIEEENWYYCVDDTVRKKRITAVRQALSIEDVCQPFSANRETKNFVVLETWFGRDYNNLLMTVINAQTLEVIPYEITNTGELLLMSDSQ